MFTSHILQNPEWIQESAANRASRQKRLWPVMAIASLCVWIAAPAAVADSLWNGGGSPAGYTTSFPLELGMQFEVSEPGQIQGVSFYKAPNDAATSHQVHLWSSSGQVLATGQTSSESASGWQTATFPSPVSIQANTIYVASYFTSSGAFSYSIGSFNNPLTAGAITAPSNTQASPGNGLFMQSSSSTFPLTGGYGTNFWVDVQFEPTATAPTGPTATTPAQFMPAWATNYTPTTEIYVSPSGNDGNDGLTRTTALQSTAAAISRLAPGVRLNFTAGTYDCTNAYVANFSGGTAQPASIRSVDGPRLATFNCGGSNEFLLDNVQGFIFEGVEITNSPTYGIQIMTDSGNIPNNLSSDVVVHNCYIHDVGLADVKGGQSQNITLISNTLGATGYGRDNAEFVAVDNVILAGNEGYGAGGFDEVKGGAHGAIIFANYIHDSLDGIDLGGAETGTQFLVDPSVDFEAENVQAWDNVIANVNDGAFRFWGCHNCTAANNTFWAPTPNSAFRLLWDNFEYPDGSLSPEIDNVNITIVNNIFASGTTFADLVPMTPNQTTGLVVQNNLWWAQGPGTVIGIYSDLPITGDPNSLYASDPDLISPPTNLQPASGSPVFGRGIPLPFDTGNYLGVLWNGNPNMGAY